MEQPNSVARQFDFHDDRYEWRLLSVSPRIKISGYSYDLETGLLTTVVPPQSRDDA